MRRDVPEGSLYAAFPSFGWGRILPDPRLMRDGGDPYLSFRLGGTLHILTVGKVFERRMASWSWIREQRVGEPEQEVDALDPWPIKARNEASVTAALLTERQRMDPDKAARRARRAAPRSAA